MTKGRLRWSAALAGPVRLCSRSPLPPRLSPRRVLAGLGLGLGLGLAWPVRADDGAAEQIEIVGKRQRPPAAVAFSPDVIDGATLQARGARSLQDLAGLSPGLQFNQGHPQQALLTLRGIGTAGHSDLLGTQQAPTGFSVDEVPFTDPFAFIGLPDLPPFDLDRVELLRGPQGVLFGSAALGGVVQLRTRRPELHAAGHALHARLETVQDGGTGWAWQAMVNQPLQPGTAAVRLVAYERHDAGTLFNRGTGQPRANALRQRGGRVALRVQPASGADVDLSLLHQQTDSADAFAVAPDRAQRSLDTPTASPRGNGFTLLRLGLQWPLAAGAQLVAVTAHLDKRARYLSDATRSTGAIGQAYGPGLGLGPLPLLPVVQARSDRPLHSRALSQEVRLQGPAAGAWDGALHYVLGGFVQHTRFDWLGTSFAPGGAALWGPAGAVLLRGDRIGSIDLQAQTREAALFGEGEWRWAGGSSLGVGARAWRTALDYTAEVRFFGRPSAEQAATAERGVSPRVLAQQTFGPHSAFAVLSRGFRFGGVNLNPPAMTPYRSDAVWNRELGLRLRPAADWRLDLGVFDIDWRDAQVATLLGGPVPTQGIANVGRARSRGAELALHWQPLTVLALEAAAAYTDARTRSAYLSSAGRALDAGARLPGTPRWQTALQLHGRFAGPAGSAGRWRLARSQVGRRVADLDTQTPLAGYVRVDVGAEWTRGAWTLGLQADNVLDSRGLGGAAVVQRPGIASFTDYYPIRPRTVGLFLRHAV